jgi:hypothetical protein
MALQVLLPLTTDLANKGLLNFKLSDDNITDVTNGKIGHCKKLTAGKNVVFIPDLNSNNISFGGWFKFNKSEISSVVSTYPYDSSRTTPTGNLLGNNSYGGIGICWNGNNMYSSGSFTAMSISLYFRTSSLGHRTIGTFAVSFDTWIHVFATFDVSTKIIKLFKDATLVVQATLPSFSDFPSRAISLNSNSVYGGNGPGFSIPIYTNDIRIYDECLSENDVKRLVNNKTFDLVNQCNVSFDRAGQIASGVIPYNVTTSGSAFYLNGSNASIRIPFTESHAGVFTMNTWFYKDSFGSKSWETILGGPSGFELEMKRSGTNSPRIAPYSWGGGSSNSGLDITYALNQWNMLTMVRNTSKTMFYLNGEYKVSGSAGSVPTTSSTAGQYFIGAWKTYDAQNFKGYIKGFQIYAKELQASEIFQLYEIGPQVDVLPDGYTRLEYIEGTGTQYINTTYPYNSSINTYRIECDWQFTGVNYNYQAPYGAYVGENNACFRIIRGNSNTVLWTYSNSKAGGGIRHTLNGDIFQRFKTIHTCTYVTYNGVKYALTNATSGNASTSTFYVMAQSQESCISKIKVWDFKIYENNTLKVWLIPSKRNSDNVIGMYDVRNGKFLTNSGSGTFTAGPAI